MRWAATERASSRERSAERTSFGLGHPDSTGKEGMVSGSRWVGRVFRLQGPCRARRQDRWKIRPNRTPGPGGSSESRRFLNLSQRSARSPPVRRAPGYPSEPGAPPVTDGLPPHAPTHPRLTPARFRSVRSRGPRALPRDAAHPPLRGGAPGARVLRQDRRNDPSLRGTGGGRGRSVGAPHRRGSGREHAPRPRAPARQGRTVRPRAGRDRGADGRLLPRQGREPARGGARARAHGQQRHHRRGAPDRRRAGAGHEARGERPLRRRVPGRRGGGHGELPRDHEPGGPVGAAARARPREQRLRHVDSGRAHGRL